MRGGGVPIVLLDAYYWLLRNPDTRYEYRCCELLLEFPCSAFLPSHHVTSFVQRIRILSILPWHLDVKVNARKINHGRRVCS